MGNLVRKPTEMLINAVDSVMISALGDGTGVMLKNYGELYSARAEWEGVANDVLKVSTRAGSVSLHVVNIKAACTDVPVEASIKLQKKARLAGQVGMSENVTVLGKDYDGVRPVKLGDCASGYLSAADNTSLATQIIATAVGERYPFFVLGKTKVIDVTDRTAAIQLDLLVDGAGTTTYDANTMALVVAAINAGSQAKAFAVEGTGVTGKIYIVPVTKGAVITAAGHDNCADSTTTLDAIGISSDDPLYQLDVSIREEDGAILSEDVGVYPYLTTQDMFRIFPLLADDQGSMPIIPIADTTYHLYKLAVKHGAYALDGANHLDDYLETLHLYVADTGTNIATFEAALKAGGFSINGTAAAPTYTTAVWTYATNASADGTVSVSIDGTDWTINVASASTPTATALLVKNAINGHNGFTATVDTGEVTVTKATGIVSAVATADIGATTVSAVVLS